METLLFKKCFADYLQVNIFQIVSRLLAQTNEFTFYIVVDDSAIFTLIDGSCDVQSFQKECAVFIFIVEDTEFSREVWRNDETVKLEVFVEVEEIFDVVLVVVHVMSSVRQQRAVSVELNFPA